MGLLRAAGGAGRVGGRGAEGSKPCSKSIVDHEIHEKSFLKRHQWAAQTHQETMTKGFPKTLLNVSKVPWRYPNVPGGVLVRQVSRTLLKRVQNCSYMSTCFCDCVEKDALKYALCCSVVRCCGVLLCALLCVLCDVLCFVCCVVVVLWEG